MINVNWDEIPLGLISDSDIARDYNLNKATVYNQRKKRNIQKYSNKPEIDWEKYRTLTDVKIAEIYKCKFHHVAKSRKEHNILDCRSERLRDIDWSKPTKELKIELEMSKNMINEYKRKYGYGKFDYVNSINWSKQPLGKVSDGTIEKKLKVSIKTVATRRRKMKIEPYQNPNHNIDIDWSKQPLGQITDYKIAEKLGVSKTFVSTTRTRLGIKPVKERRRYDIDWDNIGLGKMNDYALARKIGVPHMSVFQHRVSKGIPAYYKNINWDEVPLGKVRDKEIAEKYKVSKVFVAKQRRKRGIKHYEN